MPTYSVLILGAGKIGSLICCLLSSSKKYKIFLGNLDLDAAESLIQNLSLVNVDALRLDAREQSELENFLRQNSIDAIVSSLPFYCNPLVADMAVKYQVHYFDLTEDVAVTNHVRNISKNHNNIFMPQCGLAPGFISIAANDIMKKFDSIDTVKMRVGALPVNPHNALKYSLTWSTDGLINEYGNLSYGIENGEITTLLPLEGYETISLDGVVYEAFNTSGGLGTLAESYDKQVATMNYKTLRYPGHCKDIKLLMNDLKLNQDRATLKRILERAVPKTVQDVVLIYVAVNGIHEGDFFEQNYVKKIYPIKIANKLWSSIQITTAAGICSVMDITLNNAHHYHGFICQEQIELGSVLDNQFGKYYKG